MYLVTAPWIMRKLFPSYFEWEIETKTNEIFLTFDDGPHPKATPFVLDELKKYNAKATFFCIGKNVEAEPGLYKRILNEGHSIGNHTNDHLNGKKTADKDYLNNILKAKEVIDSKLFRPPYGEISTFQGQQLKGIFRVIMWNVLSADFDVKLTGEQCYKNVVKNTKPGAIIVFHDSEKAFPRLEIALPAALAYFQQKGYSMKSIR